MTRTAHPLPVGTAVHHIGQIWARRLPGGTAVIREVQGPYHDGAYEYLLDGTRDFSARPGPDNPMNEPRQWASYATIPAPATLTDKDPTP
ncbi:hypothetical protein [Streptomyces sp. TRM68367]|uniref:hypothetical protein n=1 Tax=Streptomyces sp. TRM68367 TaxID=2758415 RepID=UPI00165A1EE9|nr:hypothetical protein [Streptomyces sp. TRM68367]MBC9731159.1 hypothetical protein [Streptomyces sp. TRM68367]